MENPWLERENHHYNDLIDNLCSLLNKSSINFECIDINRQGKIFFRHVYTIALEVYQKEDEDRERERNTFLLLNKI